MYTDSRGCEYTFFGFDAESGVVAGSFWKKEDAAGNIAYIGHATDPATAINDGYDTAGWIEVAYDTSGRRFTYTYGTFDGVQRLTEVEAEVQEGAVWESVISVEYDYYLAVDTHGGLGDLKQVAKTIPMTDAGIDQTFKTYYRYWTGPFDQTTNPGYDHALRYIVSPEGVRQFDWSDQDFDDDHQTATDTALNPYAGSYFEYDIDSMVSQTWFNGECGCSGSNNGQHTITYDTNGSYTDDLGYDEDEWLHRAVISRPDGSYLTQYFDETGQSLHRVLSDKDPADATASFWVFDVDRDASGQIVSMHTPANNDSYTHSTGLATRKANDGLVTHYTRKATGPETGFVITKEVSDGAAGTKIATMEYTYHVTVKSSIGVGGDSFVLVRPTIAGLTQHWTSDTGETTSTTSVDPPETYDSDGHGLVIKSMQTVHPAVTPSRNGNDTTAVSGAYFRKDGTIAFRENLDGTYDYTKYMSGRVIQSIRNVDIDDNSFPAGDDPQTDFGFPVLLLSSVSQNSPTTTQDTTHDSVCRPIIITTLWGDNGLQSTSIIAAAAGEMPAALDNGILADDITDKVYYTRLADGRSVQIAVPRAEGGTSHGPFRYSIQNQAGQTVASGVLSVPGNGTTPNFTSENFTSWIDELEDDPVDALTLSNVTIEQWVTSAFNETGTQLDSTQAYFGAPQPQSGSSDYDETTYTYDDMGRQSRMEDPTGTITRQEYDAIGRLFATYTGTDDTGDPGSSMSGTNNMTKVSEAKYDDGGIGNSLVTEQTLFVDDSADGDERIVTFQYDFRDRRVVTTPPVGPQTVVKYGTSSRVLAVGSYSESASVTAATDPTATAADRLSLSETSYDERGQAWKSIAHEVDQSDGSLGDAVESFTWYDDAGRVIKSVGEQIIKTWYDDLSRVTHRFVIAQTDDLTYADAAGVTGDIVLEDHRTVHGRGHLPIISIGVMRDPDDTTTTGALNTADFNSLFIFDKSDMYGRASFTGMWYDDDRRLISRVDFGTLDDSNSYYHDFSAPDRLLDGVNINFDILVTTVVYDGAGRVESVADPKDLKTRYEYDSLGRQVKVIENYIDGTPGGGTDNDEDRVTLYEYTNGLQTSVTADLPGPADQTTTYTYGVIKGPGPGDSKVTSNRLLAEVEYPDSSSANDVVSYAYNAQGQQTSTTDQAGNEIRTGYDTLGRETLRFATTIVAGFDDAVKFIAMTYDDRGWPEHVTQHDIGSSVINGVKYTYDGWGNLATLEQDRDSSVGAGTGVDADSISYTYAQVDHDREAGKEMAETVRRTGMTQADGTVVTYEYLNTYNSQDRFDDAASRVTAVMSGSTYVASYGYAGAGVLVETYLDEPELYSNLFDRDITQGSGVDRYPSLDHFGRITSSDWVKDGATPVHRVGLHVSWDRNSNITDVDDQVLGNKHNWSYTNDNLNRLVGADRGDTLQQSHSWTLDQLGNWDGYTLDLDGNGSFAGAGELDENRTFGDFNELSSRDTDNDGTADFSQTYDAVGNLTDDGEDFEYVYDVFGRMVTIKDTSTGDVIAEYTYNGLGYRVSERVDSNNDDIVDAADDVVHFMYDDQWRLAASFIGSSFDANDAKETWLWHAAGALDSIIHTKRDSTGDQVLNQRWYPLQNWRGDVVAVVDKDGKLEEQVVYDPYGLPTLIPYAPGADQDGDGEVNPLDFNWFILNYNAGDLIADVNGDGVVTPPDFNAWTTAYNKAITGGRGVFTQDIVGNRIGYAGYITAATPELWIARNRILNASIGAWTRRDPLGFVDGMSVYEYVKSGPIQGIDPQGLLLPAVVPIIIRISVPAIIKYGPKIIKSVPKGINKIKNWFKKKFKKKKKIQDVDGAKPPYKGEPWSTVRCKKQSRTYDSDGNPLIDRDLPHFEKGPGGKDHSHDWIKKPGKPAPTRDLPRAPRPGDPPPPRGFG